MSPTSADDAAVAGRPVRRPVLVALLTPTVLAALGTLGVLAWLSGWLPGETASTGTAPASSTVGVALGDLLPFAAMAALTVLAVRSWPRGLLALGTGVVVLAVGSAVPLGQMLVDESSTGVLLLLFLPFYQVALVLVTLLATVLLDSSLALRRPRP